MAENEAKGDAKRRTIRLPPSIPFLWEERPGIAKKNWKPVASSFTTTLPPPSPIKLIASVPFNWEEKPGTPLGDFSQPVAEPTIVPSSAMLMTLPPPPVYSPAHFRGCNRNDDRGDRMDPEANGFQTDNSFSSAPIKLIASVAFNWEEKPGTPLPSFSQPPVEHTTVPPSTMLMTLPLPPAYFNGCNNNNDRCDRNDKQAVFEMYHEASGFETDDSFSSVQSMAISTNIPIQKTYQIDNGSDHLETPSSPASETDSTSSYATGASSLVGTSFLECLFPLLPPNTGFLEKVRYPDQESRAQSDFDRESNNTVVIRKPPTLGELIMMSRRRSYQRKAAQTRENHTSMEYLKERAPGCCIFGTDIKIIEGLQLKKFPPRLKFF